MNISRYKIIILLGLFIGVFIYSVDKKFINILGVSDSKTTFNKSQYPPRVINFSFLKVLGQPTFQQTAPNKIVANKGFLMGGIHIDKSGRIYVFDSGNNRVLGFQNYEGMNAEADIVIGQPSLYDSGTANGDNNYYLMPNSQTLALLPYPQLPSTQEGSREEQMTTDDQNNLYIVDLNNNRVLKYNDPFSSDSIADEVWGQSDFTSRQSHCGVSGVTPSASTFCTEWGTNFNKGTQVFMAAVEIDSQGNLWVADTGNNRVLRFSKKPDGTISKTADLVLGQDNFTDSAQAGCWNSTPARMFRPVSLKFHPVTGDLYVLQGEDIWSGSVNNVMVFNKPFTSGMASSKYIGSAIFQDEEPADTTGWYQKECGGVTKWVFPVSGLKWARGLEFAKTDVSSDIYRLWVSDIGNRRILAFDPNSGEKVDIIGQPDFVTDTCYGHLDQGIIDCNNMVSNVCSPFGAIDVDSDNNLYIPIRDDSGSIQRFPLPLVRNDTGKEIANGCLLYRGNNEITGKNFNNSYGMSFFLNPENNRSQLYVSDSQRLLVWNNINSPASYGEADYVVGQDTKTENGDCGGIFDAIRINHQTVGTDKISGKSYLWVSASNRIFAFELPIRGGGKDYRPKTILYPGTDSKGNVYWADDHSSKVFFNVNGLYYNEEQNALWISDVENNRAMRIINPLKNEAYVDLVIGQKNKQNTCQNACADKPNAKGFAHPWTINFDKKGNLYVVDSKYEGGDNNRVLRFSSEVTVPIQGRIFPFPDANGVYAKPNFHTGSNDNIPDYLPKNPVSVSFDSENRMLLMVDSYGNTQYHRAFLYGKNHDIQARPKPEGIIPIPFGQPAFAFFYPDNQHLMIQDHTWSRILFIKIQNVGVPGFEPGTFAM